ncbi:MAG: hypothetical protein QOF01_1974, partial [Thermomicrobiales bacterium]|nr:hypothetical protein [Thermomicrobiales bacterium]
AYMTFLPWTKPETSKFGCVDVQSEWKLNFDSHWLLSSCALLTVFRNSQLQNDFSGYSPAVWH